MGIRMTEVCRCCTDVSRNAAGNDEKGQYACVVCTHGFTQSAARPAGDWSGGETRCGSRAALVVNRERW